MAKEQAFVADFDLMAAPVTSISTTTTEATSQSLAAVTRSMSDVSVVQRPGRPGSTAPASSVTSATTPPSAKMASDGCNEATGTCRTDHSPKLPVTGTDGGAAGPEMSHAVSQPVRSTLAGSSDGVVAKHTMTDEVLRCLHALNKKELASAALRSELARVKAEHAEQQLRIQQQEKQLDELRQENTQLRGDSDGMRDGIARAKTILAANTASAVEAGNLKIRHLETTRQLKTELLSLKSAIQQIRNQKSEDAKAFAEFRAGVLQTVRGLREARDSARRGKEALSRTCMSLEHQLAELRESMKAQQLRLSEVSGSSGTLGATISQNKALKRKLRDMSGQLNSVTRELGTLKQKVHQAKQRAAKVRRVARK